MTAALAPSLATITCADFACLNAISHESLCTCACGGDGHGQVHRAGRQAARDAIDARIARTGDVFLGAADAARRDDELDAAMGIGPIRRRRDTPWCHDCMNAADDCECEA